MLPPIPRTIKGLEAQGFVIVPPGSFDADETTAAESYWSDVTDEKALSFYNQTQPWALDLARLVQDLGVTSVFEFGCNVGRNLRCIRDENPDIERLGGIDINPHAIEFGRRENGLPLEVGGLEALGAMPNGAYELVFTVSVLDHIPKITEAIDGLVRVASRCLFCLEVTLPVEGKVVRYFDRNESEVRDATTASYSWDVAKYLRTNRKVGGIDVQDYELQGTRLGPYYKRYLATLR